MIYETEVSSNVIKIIGRLPNLSDILPSRGLNKNCTNENIAIKKPISKSETPRSLLANVGNMGIRIPNPIKSINTVKKITDREALFFKR